VSSPEGNGRIYSCSYRNAANRSDPNGYHRAARLPFLAACASVTPSFPARIDWRQKRPAYSSLSLSLFFSVPLPEAIVTRKWNAERSVENSSSWRYGYGEGAAYTEKAGRSSRDKNRLQPPELQTKKVEHESRAAEAPGAGKDRSVYPNPNHECPAWYAAADGSDSPAGIVSFPSSTKKRNPSHALRSPVEATAARCSLGSEWRPGRLKTNTAWGTDLLRRLSTYFRESDFSLTALSPSRSPPAA
jgi:hypothetical protein